MNSVNLFVRSVNTLPLVSCGYFTILHLFTCPFSWLWN